MEIFNFFCDASIDMCKHIACAGCYSVLQIDNTIEGIYSVKKYIQIDATNNSAEILAIWLGIVEALEIRKTHPNAIFRLFSDSKISLYGVRDWMKNWIKNSQVNGCKNLISSSGQPVCNQQCFIDIFNLIVENNLHIEFYHQRGHVGEKVNIKQARTQFVRANKISPEGIGQSFENLCYFNTMVDEGTRDSLKAYIYDGILLPNTYIQPIDPVHHYIRHNMLYQYIRNIDKTSISSRHDFKGGYNQ